MNMILHDSSVLHMIPALSIFVFQLVDILIIYYSWLHRSAEVTSITHIFFGHIKELVVMPYFFFFY